MKVEINKKVWFMKTSILKGFNFVYRIFSIVIGKYALLLSGSQTLFYINPEFKFRDDFLFLFMYELVTVLIDGMLIYF